MPRKPRISAPHSLHHHIGRFLNREFLLVGSVERQEYLRRVGSAMARCDAVSLGYALMSSHVHHACRTGVALPSQWLHPLHTGFAVWLNRRLGRLGPVFSGRFTDVICPEERTAILLAYLHNNPVRAKLVADPSQTDWTSHCAYLGLVKPPPWLDVEAGLAASGFSASPSGRVNFHTFVMSRTGEVLDELLCGEDTTRSRLSARRLTGIPCEVTDATLAPDLLSARREIVAVPGTTLRSRWPGAAEQVAARVAALYGVEPLDLPSRMRRRDLTDARRAALWLWSRSLGRSQVEMGGLLGLSSSSASRLLRRAPRVGSVALGRVANELWAHVKPEAPQGGR